MFAWCLLSFSHFYVWRDGACFTLGLLKILQFASANVN